MRQTVERGLANKADTAPGVVGVDEKATAKGHRYMTLVCDLEVATVEYFGEEHIQARLAAYSASLASTRRGPIGAVSMDIWEPHIKATTASIPPTEDKIILNRLHIVQAVPRSVNPVSRAENRGLWAEGDTTLVKIKHLWLHSFDNLRADAVDHFLPLPSRNLNTVRAWKLKESLRNLEVYQARLGAAVPEEMLLPGNAQRSTASDRGGTYDQPAFA